MRAAILAIGDELTSGYRLDTNSQFIARRLATTPLDVTLHLTVGDDSDAIRAGLRTALQAADVVIASGGLGPTQDDLTRQAVAAFFGCALEEDAETVARMRERFARRGRPMPANNLIQAQIPAGSQVIRNDWGTAAGFYVRAEKQHLFVVPGVPYEMEGMLESFILPRLRQLTGGGRVVRRGVLKLFGPTESEVAERIRDLLPRDRNPLLGLLAHRGLITVEVVAWGETEQEAVALLAADALAVRQVFGSKVLCEDERDLPQLLVDLLAGREWTLAVTEAVDGSGGAVAARLSEAEGCAAILRGCRVIGDVPLAEEQVGAVAGEARRTAGADVGLAVSSMLFPAKEPPERPQGGILVAAVALGAAVSCQRFSYTGERLRVREFPADAALGLLWRVALSQEGRS